MARSRPIRHPFREHERLGVLAAVSSAVAGLQAPAAIAERALDRLLAAGEFAGGWVRLAPDHEGGDPLLVHRGLPADLLRRVAERDEPFPTAAGRPAVSAAAVADRAARGATDRARRRAVAAVGIAVHGRPIGTLGVLGAPHRPAGADDLRLLTAVADQIGIAVGNARLHAAARERERQARILYETAVRLNAQTDLEGLLTAITAGAVAATGASFGSVGFPEGDELVMRRLFTGAASGPPVARLKISESLAGLAFLTGEPQVSNDPAADPRVNQARAVGMRNAICTPLQIAGRVTGVLFVANKATGPFTAGDVAVLTTFASHAAAAIEHARLHAETARREREVSILYRLSSRLHEPTPPGDLLRRIVEAAIEITDAAWGGIGQPRGEAVVIDPLVGHGPRGMTERRVPLAGSAAARVFATGEPVIVNDLDRSPCSAEVRERARADGVRNFICAPLKSWAAGGTFGIIEVCNKKGGGDFTADDVRLLTTFGAHAALAIENARLFQEMKATKEYLENLIESSVDAIVTLDRRGRITFVSRGGQRMLGYGPEEALGTPFDAWWARGPEDAGRFWRALAAEGRLQSYETELRAADGRPRAVNISASPLQGGDGEPVGVVAVIRDVTELKRLQQQMIQHERLSAAGLLAAGVAHEVGNAVTCLSSLCQVMAETVGDPALRRGLGEIQVQIERIERTVQDLGRLAQPRPFELRDVPVAELIELAIQLARHSRAARRMRVVTVPVVEPVLVRGSPDHLVQVFLNLILNAADAGGDLTIDTAVAGSTVRLSFRDTGRGMSGEQLGRLFVDPFCTTKAAEGHLGLGLFVCREIVVQHRGRIEVESRPGAGTTVTVVLPRAAGAADPEPVTGATLPG